MLVYRVLVVPVHRVADKWYYRSLHRVVTGVPLGDGFLNSRVGATRYSYNLLMRLRLVRCFVSVEGSEVSNLFRCQFRFNLTTR